jgi:hypothetical protein
VTSDECRHGKYLFGVAEGLDPGDLTDQPGLGGQPLRVVEHAGLQAVVCDVPLGEYGEEALRQHLEDLTWVERVARTHDAVIRAVAAHTTVAPLRLVTVCVDDDSVVERLRTWENPLRDALARVRGCREWSVKAYVPTQPEPEPAIAGPATAGAGAGRAYLEGKRDRVRQRQQTERQLADAAEALHIALAGRSRASRRLAAQDPQLSGRAEPMVLNGAYLVAESDENTFRALVEELQQRYREVSLEVGGPWAPYSFAVLESVDDR